MLSEWVCVQIIAHEEHEKNVTQEPWGKKQQEEGRDHVNEVGITLIVYHIKADRRTEMQMQYQWSLF